GEENPRDFRERQITVHRSIRTLVIDDEVENADLFKLILSKEGYLVTSITDPTKTVDELKAREYQLVILDMMMPQMSGTEVLAEIRKWDTDIAVIVATGYPTVD